jgi:hypothetical protein
MPLLSGLLDMLRTPKLGATVEVDAVLVSL